MAVFQTARAGATPASRKRRQTQTPLWQNQKCADLVNRTMPVRGRPGDPISGRWCSRSTRTCEVRGAGACPARPSISSDHTHAKAVEAAGCKPALTRCETGACVHFRAFPTLISARGSAGIADPSVSETESLGSASLPEPTNFLAHEGASEPAPFGSASCPGQHRGARHFRCPIAQWWSSRLLSGRLMVRIHLGQPFSARKLSS